MVTFKIGVLEAAVGCVERGGGPELIDLAAADNQPCCVMLA